MHFFVAFVLSSLALLLQTTQAFPTADNWVVLNTEQTVNGTLTLYRPSLALPSEVLPHLTPKCGWPEQSCGDSGRAEVSSCIGLLNTLTYDKDRGLGVSPRSICLEQNDNRCCVSWGRDLPKGFKQGYLAPPVRQLVDKCSVTYKLWGLSLSNPSNNHAAGQLRNIQVNDVCNNVCLSEKPWGCE